MAATLVTHAPTTIGDAVAQQLRTAVDALAELRNRWMPRLATASLDRRPPAPMVVIRARRALHQVEDGIARAHTLDYRARTPEVTQLLAIVTSERDALAPIVDALLARPRPEMRIHHG